MFLKRLVIMLFLTLAPLAALASSDAAHPVSPEQALQMLSEGNLRFALGQSAHPNTSFSRRLLTTTDGQAPFATIIACSDSRVPVEILFDQGVGDLFVIKVAGNVADTDEIGSAEYGVDHLGTPVLMVLGHTYCGAVTAVTTGAEVHGSIPKLVDNIVPAVERAKHAHPEAEKAELINAAIEENVWQAIDDIMGKSHAIAERAAAGKVVVVGAIYDILTGKVRIIERAGAAPAQAHAAPAAQAEAAAAPAAAHAQAEPAMDGKAAPAKHETQAKEKKHETPAKAEPAKGEPAKDGKHAEPAVAKDAAHGEKDAAHAGEGSSGGGFGFFSFIVFVLLLIGAVFILDKKVLNPEEK
jgi:carbonic anhydrase